ncbi:putative transmembrane protein [Gregarina niphandrodes]|uniref:Transmembrane protein n=1 Tax=Gregarina niphandrodes TaxID=110365 RepID=A0A023BDP8_GRENI|nr:putative transmembrane protein [Gregarina niphandrodes]EZG89736.1 putative transmembrane protein [Gregarina niphandrodes]|eukprot:XP_011128444.1 putative transmembrane protein [Gregarina niphandrodes]
MDNASDVTPVKNFSASFSTLGSWASSRVKTVAATLENAAAAGRQAVESKLQELIEESDEEQALPPTADPPTVDLPPAVEPPPAASPAAPLTTLSPEDGPLAQAILSGEIHAPPALSPPAVSPRILPGTDSVYSAANFPGGPGLAGAAQSEGSLLVNGQKIERDNVVVDTEHDHHTHTHADHTQTDRTLTDGHCTRPASGADGEGKSSATAESLPAEGTCGFQSNELPRPAELPAAVSQPEGLPRPAAEAPAPSRQYPGLESSAEEDSARISPDLVGDPTSQATGQVTTTSEGKAEALPGDLEQLMETTARLSTQVLELEGWVKTLQLERDELVEQVQALEESRRMEGVRARQAGEQCAAMAAELQARTQSFQTAEQSFQTAEQTAQRETERLATALRAEQESGNRAREALQTRLAELETESESAREKAQQLGALVLQREEEAATLRGQLEAAARQHSSDSLVATDELLRSKAQTEHLKNQLGSLVAERDELKARLYEVQALKNLVKDTVAPNAGGGPHSNEDAHSDGEQWAELIKTRLSQLQSQLRATEAANSNLMNQYNELVRQNQQWQTRVLELESETKPQFSQETRKQVDVDTVMALEERLAGKSQRLDQLIAENHALKIQLQQKSPFSHVENEFHKSAVLVFVAKPVLKLLSRLLGKTWRQRAEEKFRRFYASLLSSALVVRLNYVVQRLLQYQDGTLIIGLTMSSLIMLLLVR